MERGHGTGGADAGRGGTPAAAGQTAHGSLPAAAQTGQGRSAADLPEPALRAAQAFRRVFGRDPEAVAAAPGRVNLIGEHTDYTGGFVLPVAIDRAVAVAGARRPDRSVHVYSLQYGQRAAFEIDALTELPAGFSGDPAARGAGDPVQGAGDPARGAARRQREASWVAYVEGVWWALGDLGHRLPGADLAVAGDVPLGAGLSSSAAVEMACVMIAAALGGLELDPLAAIRAAHRAENEFVGVRCGIMDQFVACLARRGHALFLDTDGLGFQYVPLPPQAALVVTDTGQRRELAGSGYNRRREECEQALALARRHLSGWRLVRELDGRSLQALRPHMPEVLWNRLSHLVEENARVQQAVQALRASDLKGFGELMNASHESLRNQFEVSSPALDEAVAIARAVPGVLGARMTGAGFGGCTVSLALRESVDRLVAALREEYPRRMGQVPQVWVVEASDGARRLDVPPDAGDGDGP